MRRLREPFVNGTIFGRAANLWVAAVGAIFNLLVVFQVGGFNPDSSQQATANLAIVALIALFANARENAVAEDIKDHKRR